jgi:hypothetical protein
MRDKDKDGSSNGSQSPRGRNDYEVGYCRPPKHSQFKPGQSGNRKGRPKSSENSATIAKRVFSRKITVREAGKERKVSLLEGVYIRIGEKALKGEDRAIGRVLDLFPPQDVSECDKQEILEEILPQLTDDELSALERVSELGMEAQERRRAARGLNTRRNKR